MKNSDFLSSKAICANLNGTTKEEVLKELVDVLINTGDVKQEDKDKLYDVLMARESLGSTAIGQGVAIPHGKCEYVDKLIGCLAVSKQGIDFNSLDGEPSHIFFLLLAPVDSAGPHLKALAKISKLLKDKYIRDSLKSAKDEQTILDIIKQEDERLSSAS